MKPTLLIIFTLLFTINPINAKEYNLNIKVFSLGNSELVQGAEISTVIDGVTKYIGKTDSTGSIFILDLDKKEFIIKVIVPNSNYKSKEIYYEPNKEKDAVLNVFLRWDKTYERQLRNERDARYESDTLKKHKICKTEFISSLAFNKEVKDTLQQNSIEAKYPGGMVEMQKFIIDNIKYPEHCIDYGIQGKVYIEFIIQKDGAITNIKVVKSVHKDIDEEAVSVIFHMPNFIPSTLNDEPVKTIMRLPIYFNID